MTKGVDVNDPISDYYNEYLPYQKKFDVLGMAEQKILQIPLQMVDPINRNIVVIGSSLQVAVYNKTLISAEQDRDLRGVPVCPRNRPGAGCPREKAIVG